MSSKKNLPVVLFCMLVQTVLLVQAHAAQSPASSTPVYVCHRASGSITIDGKYSERTWKKAQVINKFFVPVTLKPAASKTEARMLWDDKYLYVAFKAYDKDVRAVLTKRDAPTCTEDCLEIFIQPDTTSTAYCNFEINALGTVFDALNPTYRAPGSEKWDCKGIKVATTIKGTLNNPKDVDQYWTLEEAIPLNELPLAGGRLPKPGDTWKFHVARYDYSDYLPKGVELSSCAHLTKEDFHDASEWCILKFAE